MNYRDLIEIVVSCLAGFVFGYITCAYARPRIDPSVLKVNGRTVLGLLILAMMVATGVLYYQASSRQTRFIECQEQQNEALAQAIKARAQASSDVDDAQRVFLKVRANPAATDEQRIASINVYLDALDKIDNTRSNNPLIAGGCH